MVERRHSLVISAFALLAGCTPETHAPPATIARVTCPSASAPVASAPPPTPPTPPARPTITDPLLRRVVSAMDELPEKEHWLLRELHILSGREAAIAILDQEKPVSGCNNGQPLLLLGKTNVLSENPTSGYAVRSAPNGALLWDLRGNGPRFLVVEEWLCGFATTVEVYGLDENGEWFVAEGDARPSCVLCTRPPEQPIGGKPLFASFAVRLTVASGGPYFPTAADVYVLESWDGQRFRTDLPEFKPLYEKRLITARKEGKLARARGSKDCNAAVFLAAGEIYVYSKMLGKSLDAALAEADQLVRGISTKPCEKNHEGSMYGTMSYDWASMRDELVTQTN